MTDSPIPLTRWKIIPMKWIVSRYTLSKSPDFYLNPPTWKLLISLFPCGTASSVWCVSFVTNLWAISWSLLQEEVTEDRERVHVLSFFPAHERLVPLWGKFSPIFYAPGLNANLRAQKWITYETHQILFSLRNSIRTLAFSHKWRLRTWLTEDTFPDVSSTAGGGIKLIGLYSVSRSDQGWSQLDTSYMEANSNGKSFLIMGDWLLTNTRLR